MTKTWLYRILRGGAASLLVGAVVGGVETAIALRSSITEMVNALQRLQLWGLNAALCGAVAGVVGLALAAAIGAVAGQDADNRTLALETNRDPRHPWLPWVLGGALTAVLLVQALPSVLGGAGGGGRSGMILALVVIGGAAFALFCRLWLKRVDYTGRGAGLAILGLPTLLVLTMSVSVSASLRGGDGEASRAREGTPNLLLITVDGLRSDHVGLGARIRTPTLTWMSRKGYVFTQAATPSTSEGPPLGAVLSGRHPLSSGFLADGQRLGERAPGTGKEIATLAEVLSDEGYATGAFVSSAGLDGRATGLARGFDVYDDGVGTRRPGWSRLAVPTLLRWSQTTGGRLPPGPSVLRASAETLLRFEYWLAYHYRQNFFAWIHISDPRMPFLYTEQDPSDLLEPLPGDAGRAYGGRVAQLDEILGELFDALEEDKILDWTTVAIVGTRGHVPGGKPTVDEPWVHVPVIIWHPAMEEGVRVDEQVRLEDLPATLLSVNGLRRARMGDGISLVPLIEGRKQSELTAVSVGVPRDDGLCPISLRTPTTKYTRDPKGTDAWYDLEADPKELDDRSEADPEGASDAARELTDLLGREVPRASVPPQDPGRAAALRALETLR